jgi:hypothetical protein
MNEVDVTKQRSTLNWYQIGSLIGFVAMIVWTLAGIYFRFQQVEIERQIDRERIEYINERIDKKFNQLKDQIEDYHK